MAFKLIGDILFTVSDKREEVQSFEKSVKNLSALTVVKDSNNEDKISVSLTATQFSFCFYVSFDTEYYDDYDYGVGGGYPYDSDGYVQDW